MSCLAKLGSSASSVLLQATRSGLSRRTVRAAAKKASDDWTMASMAERQAAEATEARRAEAALSRYAMGWQRRALYASRGDDPNRRNASNSAHPHESVARIDLRRLEAEERTFREERGMVGVEGRPRPTIRSWQAHC